MDGMMKLAEIFKRHAEEARVQRDQMITKWKNEFSSDDIPEYLRDEFSLPEALMGMVEELMALKIENQKLRNDMIAMENHLLRYMMISSASTLDQEKVSEETNNN